MNAYFLYHPKTRPTGRALARLMGVRGGTLCSGKKNEMISHVIRWGNIREIPATFTPSPNGMAGGVKYSKRTEINTRQAITLAGSKFRALQAMQAAGVPVPRFYQNDPQEWAHPKHGVTLLARNYRHSRGTDIILCEPTDGQLEIGRDYFIEYIKPHNEYRVHVIGGHILFAQKKYFREELFAELADLRWRVDHAYSGKKVSEALGTVRDRFRAEADIIRNNEHGWGFHDMNSIENVPEAVQSASISAVNALGLDFGAVDVISTSKDEKGKRWAFVLEVNTAPGLRERNLQKYANAFKTLLA